MTIESYRKEIDRIDIQLLNLLNERAKIAQQIGNIKSKDNDATLYDPAREAQLMYKLRRATKGPLSGDHVECIYREIVSSCLSLEQVQKVAYLGPEGTFTQMAAIKHFGSSVQFISCTSVSDAFDTIERQHADFCVVPIENSTEGVISLTTELLGASNLRIVGEQELLVEHCLLASKPVPLTDIHMVYGHQQALAQCKHWIEEHLTSAQMEAVASNAHGARLAASNASTAAVASKLNAQLYSLDILVEKIEDIPGNKTRFVVIGDFDVAPTGKDKTALIFATAHRPGGLFYALKHFNDHSIDLTRLESKPLKTASWNYSFFVEFNGHIKDNNVAILLEDLKKDTAFIKFLGSFPQPVEA